MIILRYTGIPNGHEAEIRTVAAEFELHELPVRDAISANQRPKMERYGDSLFVVVVVVVVVVGGGGGGGWWWWWWWCRPGTSTMHPFDTVAEEH